MCACMLLNRLINSSLEMVRSIKLKLTELVVRDVELTINFCFLVITTAATIITTIATTKITNAITFIATTKDIKAKISGEFERMLNNVKTHYVHAGCQKDASAMSQELLRVLI